MATVEQERAHHAKQLRAEGVAASTLDFAGQQHAFLAWASRPELERFGAAVARLFEENTHG